MTNQEAIEAIKMAQAQVEWDYPMDYAAAFDKAIEALEQEPKTGHWIECMPGGAEEWCYKCSECDFWKYKKTINLSKFKFCPNCGASMVEPQESEEE